MLRALATRRARLAATSLPFIRPPIRASSFQYEPRPGAVENPVAVENPAFQYEPRPGAVGNPVFQYEPRPGAVGNPPFTSPDPVQAHNDVGDILGDGVLEDMRKSAPASQDSKNPMPFPPAAPNSDRQVYKSNVETHRFHCHSTRTNTINTFTGPHGNTLAWFSGGSCGFKKRNRSTYEAGYQCAVRMFEKIGQIAEEEDAKGPDKYLRIDLFCKGFGQGREALFKALTTAQGDKVRERIASITDRTPLKIGGTRSRKRKRR